MYNWIYLDKDTGLKPMSEQIFVTLVLFQSVLEEFLFSDHNIMIFNNLICILFL